MRSLVAVAAPLSTRKKYRNNVFSSSDEEDRPRTSVYRKGQSEEQPSRRGLFDEDTDDNVEEQIKERQMQKKAQWDSLQAKLNEAMQTVETHKNDMLQVTNQLSAAIAKVEKRNRQLHNAKSLVQSLQQSLAQLQTQLDEEKQARSREKEEWATEKAALQQEIDELKSGKVSPPVNTPVSPTTLLGKIWSKKKESPAAPNIVPTTTLSSQRPPMFTVPIISSDEDESSDSIAGSDDDSPSEEEPPKMQPEEPVVVDQKAIPIGVSRMNFYMEERMKKEAEKRQKELKEQQEKNKLQEEFENEWAALAQETRELKKNKKLKKPTKANTRVQCLLLRQTYDNFRSQGSALLLSSKCLERLRHPSRRHLLSRNPHLLQPRHRQLLQFPHRKSPLSTRRQSHHCHLSHQRLKWSCTEGNKHDFMNFTNPVSIQRTFFFTKSFLRAPKA
ncbi:hypothetical protein AC1031_012504 [Aphanomyces cochlioides]|nr:hypothetical protein AC1031_012504 [Aphanomyces cochlioides]